MALSQARFVHVNLYALIDELFQADTLGHLRRAQGLVRVAHQNLQALGREAADPIIAEAIGRMRHYSKVRVSYFSETLSVLKRERFHKAEDREIQRLPGNPMLRNQPAGCEHGTNQQPAGIGVNNGNYTTQNTDA